MALDSDQSALEARARHLMAEWVSAIAHNLNNPIAGVMASLGILRRDLAGPLSPIPQTVNEGLSRIELRLKDLSEYVAELYEFAKPIDLVLVRLSLSHLIDETISSLVHPNTKFVQRIKSPEFWIQGDFTRLKQAFRRLLENALDATIHGAPPCIRVTVQGEGSVVKIFVSDNGEGFSREALSRFAEPFFSTKEAGTGLGLAIAKKVVLAHGGTLEFTPNELGAGATLVMTLPQGKK